MPPARQAFGIGRGAQALAESVADHAHDVRLHRIDHLPLQADPPVEIGKPFEIVANRLIARDVRERALDGLEESRHLVRRRAADFRIGLEIDETAIHLAMCDMVLHRLERHRDRLVHQHAAVDEGGGLRILAGIAQLLELLRDEATARHPWDATNGTDRIDLAQPRRREGTGIAARRPCREGERGDVVLPEPAVAVPGGVPDMAKMQDEPMLALLDHRRIVEPDRLPMAPEIRRGDKEFERQAEGQERAILLPFLAQSHEGIEHQFTHP